MRETLLYFIVKYEGKWSEVFRRISKKEKIDLDELENFKETFTADCITILDDDYPDNLKVVTNPPFVIFYKGNINLIKDPKYSLGVIGSRNNSTYGEEMTKKIVKQLVENDIVIVSGLARGIDALAHENCLKNNGKTIAILGSGIDVCYPASNQKIYNDIIENGGLIISEYPPGTKAKKENFPMRNRLISAFSDSLLVIESKQISGTSITINFALDLGKDIFCIPERANVNSGCNKLIRNGAVLVESASDILEEIKYSLN